MSTAGQRRPNAHHASGVHTAFGNSLATRQAAKDVARSLQQRLIHGIRCVQHNHIRDRQAPFVAREPLDSISYTDLAFALDGEIEPAAPALVETLDHLGLPEADPSL